METYDELKKLTIDQLRSKVSKLKIMTQSIMKDRKLKKKDLIDLIIEYKNNQSVEIPTIENSELKNIFPFEKEVFDEYRNFEIIENQKKLNKKFKMEEIDYQIKFNSPNITDIDLKKIFKTVLFNLNVEENDRFQIIIRHSDLDKPVSTKIQTFTKKDSSYKLIAEKLTNTLNSNQELDLRQAIINVRVFHMPKGQKGTKTFNVSDSLLSKTSINLIINNDDYCLPRAIVIGLTYHDNQFVKDIFKQLDDKEFTESNINYIRDKRKPLSRKLAIELLKYCEIGTEHFFGTLDDIKKIQQKLNIQINIVCVENSNKISYSGPNKEIKIYLYKVQNHFHTINNIKAFYGTSYYCDIHKKSYNNKNSCKECKKENNDYCHACCKTHKDLKENIDWKYCEDCFRYFPNSECYDNHKEINKKGYSICETIWKCVKCKKVLERKEQNVENHICGHAKCRNCLEYCNIDEHECYIQEISLKIPSEKLGFFDVECCQDTGIHIVNHVHVKDFNDKSKIFHNINDFCKWLISEKHKNHTFFAHNAKGYDSQFILKYCVENGIKFYTIYNGTKIMLLEITSLKLKIQDSMNLISGALKAFPKTFDLKELKKGFFPHYFNKPENYEYVGTLPPKEDYGYNNMKYEDRKEFLKWHNKNKDIEFNFKKELKEYCESDVDILRKGLLEFRKNYLEIGIDPLQYLTIASVCMAIYRNKDMPENSIAVVKDYSNDTFSKKSIYWLDYLSKTNDNIFIQHAINEREKKINGKKVDGFHKKSNTIYQFHGCFWHGCQKCYKNTDINHRNKITMKDLYEKTLKQSEEYRKNYNLIEIWECEFDEIMKTKEFKNFKKDYDDKEIVTNLIPRDAFFGGRTNATKLKYHVKDGERLKYIDVVSLYPTVQYYDYYPIGHPKIILKPEKFDNSWFGLIKCKILPPRKLYHPVLPAKIKTENYEKLLFTLCSTCAKNQIKKCDHNDEERSLIGTWCINEVQKALEKGYKILKIYEVHNFKEKSNELFKTYIQRFIKIKQEASGLPNGYTKEKYIKENFEQLGIKLDPDKIEYNPGRRAIAKMCLNNLWGKFGQRKNLPKTEQVTELKKFYEILLDERLKDININQLTEETLEITYKYKDMFVNNEFNTNEYIAAFTTANARLRLYKMLDKLGESVIYFDTDSIVYIDNGKNTIKTGSMLGEWTLEDEFDSWLSTGPKSYSVLDIFVDKPENFIEDKALEENWNNERILEEIELLEDFEIISFKCKSKVKGFTLNFKNSQIINHESMNKLIKNEIESLKLIDENKITRNSKNKTIVNKYQEKVFKLVYDKRTINYINENHIDSLPCGY